MGQIYKLRQEADGGDEPTESGTTLTAEILHPAPSNDQVHLRLRLFVRVCLCACACARVLERVFVRVCLCMLACACLLVHACLCMRACTTWSISISNSIFNISPPKLNQILKIMGAS